ncbi:hypothetical protein Q669_31885 [Labrenzia sp. C1B10]|nr:hypothetical protein Q669_31885 [Labrenzia sp. C1B10]ERS04117.1 hypothetical protein Q675_30945 [Labrenzia sp. C1B70]
MDFGLLDLIELLLILQVFAVMRRFVLSAL